MGSVGSDRGNFRFILEINSGFDANNHRLSFVRCFGWFEWVIQYYSTMGIRAIELRSTPGNLLDFRRLRSSIWPVPPRRVLGFLKKNKG